MVSRPEAHINCCVWPIFWSLSFAYIAMHVVEYFSVDYRTFPSMHIFYTLLFTIVILSGIFISFVYIWYTFFTFVYMSQHLFWRIFGLLNEMNVIYMLIVKSFKMRKSLFNRDWLGSSCWCSRRWSTRNLPGAARYIKFHVTVFITVDIWCIEWKTSEYWFSCN